MLRSTLRLLLLPLTVAALAACGAPAAVPLPTVSSAPTSAAMAAQPTGEVMADKPSGEAMADKPTSEAMAEQPTEAAMMDKPTGEVMAKQSTEVAVVDQPTAEPVAEQPVNLPAWQQIVLTDVRSGQSFNLADFAGRTVFVEPMATWCSNCRAQLGNVRDARAQLGDDVIFVALSVETNLAGAELAAYAEANDFDWTFAVASPELLQELAVVFGRTITNPPSTPHFIIRPDGSFTELKTGIESPEKIIEQINAAS